MRHSKEIADKLVVINCDGRLSVQAEWLLGLLERLHLAQGILRSGARIQVGWSILTMEDRGGELHVCEPTYDADPFHGFRDDLTCTLGIQARQNDILKCLGLHGTDWSFQDKVVLARGILAAKHIYLERRQPQIGDSGWYIGPVESGKSMDDFEAVYAYQLLAKRPALLQVFALPPGYLVTFDGDRIEEVVDSANQRVWPRQESQQGSPGGAHSEKPDPSSMV